MEMVMVRIATTAAEDVGVVIAGLIVMALMVSVAFLAVIEYIKHWIQKRRAAKFVSNHWMDERRRNGLE
jgi:hypothetical protein